MTDTQRGDAVNAPQPGDDRGPREPRGHETESGDGPWHRFQEWRESLRSRPGADRIYRIAVGVLGGAIVLGGFALVPLPGPGWLIVFLGLAILASEFVWAHRLEQYTRQQVSAWTHWLGRQNLAVRALIGLLTAVFVVAVVYAVLRVLGVPGWLPDDLIGAIPGLTP